MHKNVEIGEDKIFPFFMKHPNCESVSRVTCKMIKTSHRPSYTCFIFGVLKRETIGGNDAIGGERIDDGDSI